MKAIGGISIEVPNNVYEFLNMISDKIILGEGINQEIILKFKGTIVKKHNNIVLYSSEEDRMTSNKELNEYNRTRSNDR